MSNKIQDFTTIDACLSKVTNRFELAVIASKRAEEIENGSTASIESDHKSTVIALEEISSGALQVDLMREKIISGMQKHVFTNVEKLDLNEDEDYDDIGSLEVKADIIDNYIENESDFSLSEDEMTLLDDEDMNFKS
jgi:DNA-directed RNA polymerase subunit omega